MLPTGLSSAVGASEHLLSHPASTFRSPAAPAEAAADVVFFSLAKAESRLSDCDCFSAEAEEEKEEFLKALEKLSEPLLGGDSVMPWNHESN